MNTRVLSLIIAAIGCVSVGASAAVVPVTVTEPESAPQFRDLANLAEALGIHMNAFDYETKEPHCLSMMVEANTMSCSPVRHNGGVLCGQKGPHRLTIQLTPQDRAVSFKFVRFRRDIDQGGSVAGPTIPIPTTSGLTIYGIEKRELRADEETLLVHGAYGWNEGPRTEFRVIGQLKENPNGFIGTRSQ